MYKWLKDIAQWTVKDTLYLSVVFTWDLPRAREIAQASKKRVVAGGPAVMLMPDYLADVAKVQGSTKFPALAYHNPMATFTTRGCPNLCPFCAVPSIEGSLVELKRWEIKPLVCDNNLLAASDEHIYRVIDSLKVLPFVDFNQGLDARLFARRYAEKIAELPNVKVRFAFDYSGIQGDLDDAVETCRQYGVNDIGVYVLVGHESSPDEDFYRLEHVRGVLGIRPNPMRYQPLYALKKNEYLPERWVAEYGSREKAEIEMLRLMQYWSRLNWHEHIPFDEYIYRDDERHQEVLF